METKMMRVPLGDAEEVGDEADPANGHDEEGKDAPVKRLRVAPALGVEAAGPNEDVGGECDGAGHGCRVRLAWCTCHC